MCNIFRWLRRSRSPAPVYIHRQIPHPVYRIPDHRYSTSARYPNTWYNSYQPSYHNTQPFGYYPEPTWLRNPPVDYVARNLWHAPPRQPQPNPWDTYNKTYNPPRRTRLPEWRNPQAQPGNTNTASTRAQSHRSLPGHQPPYTPPPHRIHPLFDSDPTGAALTWNILEPIAYAQRTVYRDDAQPQFWDKATIPECIRMQIKYDHPTFGALVNGFGPISVFPALNQTQILLGNVLHAIYDHFQQPITDDELESLSVLEEHQLLRSLNWRLQNNRAVPQPEFIRGDALLGCAMFHGLRIESSLGTSCVLHMDLRPIVPARQ